jgi:hypothetical protein
MTHIPQPAQTAQARPPKPDYTAVFLEPAYPAYEEDSYRDPETDEEQPARAGS